MCEVNACTAAVSVLQYYRFRDFFDNKVEQTQIEAKNKREHELEELKRR